MGGRPPQKWLLVQLGFELVLRSVEAATGTCRQDHSQGCFGWGRRARQFLGGLGGLGGHDGLDGLVF